MEREGKEKGRKSKRRNGIKEEGKFSNRDREEKKNGIGSTLFEWRERREK